MDIKHKTTGEILLSVDADTLRKANLYRANLREADLRGKDLYEADLRGANLRGADLPLLINKNTKS